MNKVLYTASIGEQYRVFEPTVKNKGWRIVCIADRDMDLKGWEVMKVPNGSHDNISNVKYARYIKTNPHLIFPEADISIWIDTKFTVTTNLDKFLNKYLPEDKDFVIMDHNRRDCIYREAEVIYRNFQGQDKVIEEVKNQIDKYANDKMPPHNGLYSSGIMIRRHNKPGVIKFDEMWWHEIYSESQRDMLSFAYLVWKYPKLINMNVINFKKTYNMLKPK